MHITGLLISRYIIMNNPKQLTFPWSKSNKSSFDNFFFDPINNEIKNLLKQESDLFIYGINQCGKSYLLQSVCNFYSKLNKSALYVPVLDVKKYGKEFIDSIENFDVICIDDIESIANEREWELAIFNLINNCLISECRLIFSSCKNPSSIEFSMEDLSSRIKKIDHIELFPVNDNKLYDAIKFIADSRSISLGEREINYLITYCKRNMSDLLKKIDDLDKLSMQLKRRITVPLIKEIIEK